MNLWQNFHTQQLGKALFALKLDELQWWGWPPDCFQMGWLVGLSPSSIVIVMVIITIVVIVMVIKSSFPIIILGACHHWRSMPLAVVIIIITT